MKPALLLVGNFLSNANGSRTVGEEVACRLQTAGWSVLTTSSKTDRLMRLADMLQTVYRRRKEYDVAQVEVYSYAAFIWAEAVCAALRQLGKPYILTLHGGQLPEFAKKWPGRVRRLLNSAKIVTTPSRYLHDAMQPYRADLFSLPNAIELGMYRYRLRQGATPALVWLRAFHATYNPTLAPQVVKLLVEKYPDVHLTMVGPDKGDGSLQATQAEAARLGVTDRVTFVGGVAKSEVPAWLTHGDIFLNTTNVDNTPVSVIEAMATGLCVVSTNVGGLPDLLEHDRTALLVPPNDAVAMAGAVEQILRDPLLAAHLSGNARAWAEAYDWGAVLPMWELQFNTVAGK
ncbi:MAG: D-inositol-3-phosphate glycosyltransferase [Verrucomicrobiae bacterium]|nr:D-inositol-3-phosphate glycosyltransferase [Verrucomicrobiae bacterium]